MKPTNFPEANVMVAKNQKEYLTLPSYVDKNSERGEVIFCMKLWCCLLCFGNPVTPSFFTVKKSELLK